MAHRYARVCPLVLYPIILEWWMWDAVAQQEKAGIMSTLSLSIVIFWRKMRMLFGRDCATIPLRIAELASAELAFGGNQF